MDIVSVYNDVLHQVNKDQSSLLTVDTFNSFSKRAELDLLNFLTGKTPMQKETEALISQYVTQKNKDWLSQFTTFTEGLVTEATDRFPLPQDYYTYENFFHIGGDVRCDDEDGEEQPLRRKFTSIQILDSSKFDHRTNTYIKALKPSAKKPISKMIERSLYVEPRDIGSVRLEYIRYPKFGSVKSEVDEVFNNEIVVMEKDYEWGEHARNYFVGYISDLFSVNTRDQPLMQQNQVTGK